MAKVGGLGRGLAALLQENFTPSPLSSAAEKEKVASILQNNGTNNSTLIEGNQNNSTKITLPPEISADLNGTLYIDPAILLPNPHQPRKEFNSEKLEELAQSIKEHGIIEPIIIERVTEEDKNKYYIIAGERRVRASILANLDKVPIQIRHYEEIKRLEVALIENIQRTDLNPIEEAEAYSNIMEIGDLTQEEVAKKVGKSRPVITNFLRLLKLPKVIQEALVSKKITTAHAKSLLSITNEADMLSLYNKIINEKLTVHDVEVFAHNYNNPFEGNKTPNNFTSTDINDKENNTDGNTVSPTITVKKKRKSSKDKKDRDPNLTSIEERLIETLGTKVTIHGTCDKGIIQIDYYNKDDLSRLFDLISGKN